MGKAEKNTEQSAILLIHCPDKKGIVAAVTDFLKTNDGNILYLDQHVDREKEIFFMRIEWDIAGFAVSSEKIAEHFKALIASKFNMHWRLHFSDETPRMAVFATRLSHCLYDLLANAQSTEWRVDIPLVIGNSEELRPVAERFGVDFYSFPITKENKVEQEAEEIRLLKKYKIDFIVLARYMQILTERFTSEYPERIINIHHSFLPAFPGGRPYHSAHERGVKIIGATSHYVTPELDAGPIIEQDVTRVTHQDSVAELIRKGRELEKVVLSRAVYNHIKRKILVYDNRTVVFS
ncbi:MAG: formyltetrahydrofolate deformylase [Thermodesulfobacteriota bacterium]